MTIRRSSSGGTDRVVARRWRVISSFVAFKSSTQSHGLVTVPEGAVIETSGADLHQPGLLAIKFGDEYLDAFARDINERTEPLGGATT